MSLTLNKKPKQMPTNCAEDSSNFNFQQQLPTDSIVPAHLTDLNRMEV